MDENKAELRRVKKESENTAIELGYPPVVVDKIRNATTINGVYRVLHDARQGKFNWYY